ncbi:hypothetical protein [Glaciimonas sp. PAMC28666]|uniref:hypothetical protein n=1 Tax=Glaciimonas sp. PAMC28666 TaxID=2807626 RepID=UPI0019649734|nr:hypothetical protein [Glaciimonas sp. PAMC28666]QRX83269.1 hypothetical protein JQN73_03040 [Glaciimonas sp. PAMC28666]
MQQHIINIPIESTTVLAVDMADWIANGLVPIPDTPSTLCGIKKHIPLADNQWSECDLTDEEWSLLNTILSDLPKISKNVIGKAEWGSYADAFDNAPNKPTWNLQVRFTDPVGDAHYERINVRTSHFNLIDDAIKNGVLVAHTQYLAPATKLESDTIISVEDARRWLAPSFFLHGPEFPETKLIEKQEEEKIAAGRYTLQEATNALGNGGQADPMQMLSKLVDAAKTGVLRTYAPGKTDHYSYVLNKHIRKDYEEAYWDDLNEWLAHNESRMIFRFPDPIAANQAGLVITANSIPAIENTSSTITTSNWIMRAQEGATKIWRFHKKNGCNPTKNSIRGDVADWCKLPENEVKTNGGNYPDREYIARHVLRYWTPPDD